MLFLGLISGFIVGIAVFFYVMKNYMISNHKVNGSFEQIQKVIQEIIPQKKGWGFPLPEWDIFKSQIANNLTYKNIKNMVIYFVCNPSIANKVLSVDPNMGGIMPCSWAVYETVSGDVFIAKMNIPLMSKMFFGVVGKAMSEVAQIEKVMMNDIKEKMLNKK